MSCFFYYLPRRAGAASREMLAAAGLGHVLDAGEGPASVAVGAGPGGAGGLICASAERLADERLGYYPDEQEWQEGPGGSWVGRAKGRPITGENLIRRRVLPGHAVQLMDKGEWLVPMARQTIEVAGRIGWRAALPCRDRWVAGRWIDGEIADDYRELWDLAGRWWEVVCGAEIRDGAAAFDFQGLRDAAVTALAANYLLGPAEAGMLGILSEESCVEIMQAVVDWPGFLAAQKKTGPVGSS